MKFKIVAIKKNNKKSDSLFQTQDVHYHIETPSGMQMILKYHETNCSENNAQQNICLETVFTPKLIILTQEELLEYFSNYASATKSKKLIYQSRNELGSMFERFEAQQKGVRPYGDIHHVKAQDKILLEFFNQFKGRKLNCVIEPELSIELKTELFALEKKNEEIVSYNSRNLSDNMANQANAKLKAQIKKSTDQAALEVKVPKLQKKPHPTLF